MGVRGGVVMVVAVCCVLVVMLGHCKLLKRVVAGCATERWCATPG
jgi:hypothetical protein